MRLPVWLHIKKVDEEKLEEMKVLLDDLGLHTICESGNCPNVGACFDKKTATFMILGDVCTRNCGFCGVEKGRPLPLDAGEPRRVALAAKKLKLKHVVVTSVSRDDLDDGGAWWFVSTIREIKKEMPLSTVEVLVPDFKGSEEAVSKVVKAGPDIFGHNVETVPRMYYLARKKANYLRSLGVLKEAKTTNPNILTKTGIMVGLGEKIDEVLRVMEDLREVNCDVITIGQYLSPSSDHIPVAEYVSLEVFNLYERKARNYGFRHVRSGPFVRSSFLAGDILN